MYINVSIWTHKHTNTQTQYFTYIIPNIDANETVCGWTCMMILYGVCMCAEIIAFYTLIVEIVNLHLYCIFSV